MRWRKLGQLYCPSTANKHPKLLTHAANPLPILISGDVYRIYYSGRDVNNRSSVGAVDIDIITHKIIEEHKVPFFEHGPEGSFYSNGVSIGNCYDTNDEKYMLFMGWQNSKGKHWRGDIGQLIVRPDMTLALANEAPILTSSPTDPISLSYPWVFKEKNGRYLMWYGSTLSWDAGNGEMLHVINYATSIDAKNWSRQGLSLPYQIGVSQAYSRPTVIKDAEGFHMWFSYRSGNGEKYRIGYATSVTGYEWELKLNQSGIDVSMMGWDSEMIEYPFVFDHKDKRYMLYNGNGYGKTGFGLAILNHD